VTFARAILRRVRRDRPAFAAIVVLAALAIACAIVPAASPYRWDETRLDLGPTPPSLAHWMGTDAFGRDLCARIFLGGGISLAVGLLATIGSLVLGVAWGAIAGWSGGIVDAAMMRVVQVLDALPFLAVGLVVKAALTREEALPFRIFRGAAAALGARPGAPWIAPAFQLAFVLALLGAFSWTSTARIARAETLSLRERPFVDAARVIGAHPAAIVARHVVPNLLGPVVVHAALRVPDLIAAEAFLGFIGLGAQEPLASLGLLVAQGADTVALRPWLLAGPSLLLAAMLLAANVAGDGLRDAIDPRTPPSPPRV
jgi:oligopeptide transport system permease protein